MRTKFVTTAVGAAGFPSDGAPEVAFVGRSNVGKSSLLNRIAGARIARTSKTPGRTQAINFFDVHGIGDDFLLADLPGYGYARAPKSERVAWYALIEAYLSGRDPLRAVLLLIDARRGVRAEDAEVHAWLSEQTTVVVVATKCDKLAKAKLKPALHAIAGALDLARESVKPSSSSSGQGIAELREHLAALTSST